MYESQRVLELVSDICMFAGADSTPQETDPLEQRLRDVIRNLNSNVDDSHVEAWIIFRAAYEIPTEAEEAFVDYFCNDILGRPPVKVEAWVVAQLISKKKY